MIVAGKVYKAIPPLYGITKNGKTSYYTDVYHFTQYVQKIFIKSNTITDMNKRPLTSKEMTVLFARNEEYVDEMIRLGYTHAVDPMLLEWALINYVTNVPLTRIRRDIKKQFRFMGVGEEHGVVTYDGTTKESNFLFMNERLMENCARVLSIMKQNSEFFYIMNGEVATLFQVMERFNQSKPNGIQRYKGLGEMDAEKLANSTLSPISDRTLIRYTLEDAKAEIEFIRDMESDRSKLLNFIGTVKRSDLID